MNVFPVSTNCYTLIFRCLRPSLYRSRSVPRFSAKCFYSQFTGSKVLFSLSSVFSPHLSSSRAPLYTRRARVSIYVSLSLFPFHLLSQVFTAFSFSSSPHLLFSFPSCRSLVFLSSSFPFYRAHNCITERLFSQLTLSPLRPHSVALPVFPLRCVHISIPEQNCIICSYPQQNGTMRTTGRRQG